MLLDRRCARLPNSRGRREFIMAERGLFLQCVVLCVGVLVFGCKSSERKAAAPEAAKPEAAQVAAAVAEMSDDELCAWMCGNCFREYAGLLEYPGDCRGVCIAQVSTKPCAEQLRAKVVCQVASKACDACDTEKQAALTCLRECSKLRRDQGEENLPEHCKDKTL